MNKEVKSLVKTALKWKKEAAEGRRAKEVYELKSKTLEDLICHLTDFQLLSVEDHASYTTIQTAKVTIRMDRPFPQCSISHLRQLRRAFKKAFWIAATKISKHECFTT